MIGIVKSFKPDYIGISMYESNVLQSVIFTNKIKKIMPNVKIIFGGPGGSIDRFRKYIRDNSKTNHIVLGEGEHALLNIITGKDEKQGLKNINEEPCPDYSGLINKKTKALAYYTTKGCFNDCVFCFESRTP